MPLPRFSRPRLLPAVAASTGALLTLSVVTTGPMAGLGSSSPRPVNPHFQAVSLSPMPQDAVAGAAKASSLPPQDGAGSTTPSAAPSAGSTSAPSGRTAHAQAAPTIRSGAVSPVQPTRGRLKVVGVTWPQGRLGKADRVEYRTQDNGRWGQWQPMEVSDDHAPDPGTEEARHARGGTDPYVVTGDDVQVRVLSEKASVAPDVRLDVVDPMSSPADSAAVASPGAASAAGARPTIYTRAQWGADESLRKGTPEYGTIKAGFVHHTVDSNSYTSSQVPAIIRGIYAFHVNGRGWSDIGYNFLIDKFGRTWEGRYGGIDQPVIGAHTGGFNSQLFGAAAIGTYSTTTPPTALLNAYSKLLAWKLSLAHVDAAGTVLLDGMTTKVYTVSGHRDASGSINDTECPGNALYAKLPTLRTNAKALQGTMFYGPKASSTSWYYGSAGPTITAKPSTSLTWSLQVNSPCRTETLATVKGSATTTTGINAAWNGKLASGAWAPPGEYDLTLTATTGSGTLVNATPWTTRVRVVGTATSPQGFCPDRVAGTDRYATAVAAAKSANPSARTVVLASGANTGMPDALVSAPLAKARNAALLLTAPTSLPASVSSEITRRKATTALIVGGTGAISSTVQTQLKNLGVTSITRYSGSDRYGTAAAVAKGVGASSPDVMVASGLAMADGLVLSGPAAELRRPILLVNDRGVPASTATALTQLGTERTVVAGGTGVVPDAVLAQLPSPTRVAGANRYATSSALATWARGVMPVSSVLAASGEDAGLVDTLSGGQFGRATLYVTSLRVPADVASWLDGAPDLQKATVLGGSGVVDDLVAGRVQRAVLQ
ncbi:Putative cell wall binding repeat 2 [Pedococcus cremeus]|uniref:Putative cell wall binding repeat 2 n=1 Tax=Pedococcus cremeus TaxID=587636 RepID=A0A1H9XAQ8_9MICO|nr:cell wall-binding repeat-containing protein [Pedococcus cremeus]SES43276.1 Putative cell wall binding repeat 2 [Pedococcus cremeus]